MRVVPRTPDTWLTVLVLGASGLVLAIGGVIHPHVPADPADQMTHIASDAIWVPAHWAITLAQAFALVGVALVLSTLTARRAIAPLGAAGLIVSLFGLLLGVLGTLLSVTGVRAVAESGDFALFDVLNRIDLGIGWLCVVVTTTGGVLVGADAVRQARSAPVKAFAWVLAIGSAAYLVAAFFLPPMHPWTHEFLLRSAASALGLALLATAAGWARLAPGAGRGGP